MRFFILGVVLFGFANTLFSQETASVQLERKFVELLQGHIRALMKTAPQQIDSEQLEQTTKHILEEAKQRYDVFMLLPESEATLLLSKGPDDAANRKAMEKYIAQWKTVQRPMPVLLKYLQPKVESGQIKEGFDLELIRRMSEFHLHELGL